MTDTNVDSRTKTFFERMLRLETERRDIAESVSDLAKEMKSVGLSVDEIAGIKLGVRRSFETEEKRAKRESAEAIADALGDFKDLPLGAAAVDLANNATKKLVDHIKRSGASATLEVPGMAPVHINHDPSVHA